MITVILFSAGSKDISIELKKSRSHIYTFGIYGRDFAKDGMKPTSSAESASVRNWILLIIALVGTYISLENYHTAGF